MPNYYPYDTSNVPPGGLPGQVLTKESGRSYDVGWHDPEDVVIGNIEGTVTTVLDEKIKDLNGAPNQILGFDNDGNLIPIDSTSSGGLPNITTDDEFNDMMSDIFG